MIGAVKWNECHMMITKSTTPDLIKMAARCDEYYRQQIKSGRRLFGADTVSTSKHPGNVTSDDGKT